MLLVTALFCLNDFTYIMMAVSLGSVNKGLIVIILGGGGSWELLCIQHSGPHCFRPTLLPSTL